jgi:hypothetical protein
VHDDLGVRLLGNAWNGYNCSIFAYGQTGAGKSYTMTGTGGAFTTNLSPDSVGLIPRICRALFSAIKDVDDRQATVSSIRSSLVSNSSNNLDYSHYDPAVVRAAEAEIHHGYASVSSFAVSLSYVEIYNEQINDLLASSTRAHPRDGLKLREHPEEGAYVENLEIVPVRSYQDVEKMLMLGGRARTTATTRANARSSRSHAIFTLLFLAVTEKVDTETGRITGRNSKSSKINLVDLAGSERVKHTGATGSTLNEAAHINKSLSALADVIKSLAAISSNKSGGNAKPAFVPYRNSTLTYLLKESLGGNSVTVMMACVSPNPEHFEETLSTLKYADQAKRMVTSVIMNKTKADLGSSGSGSTDALVKELRREVMRLKEEREEMLKMMETPWAGPQDQIGQKEEEIGEYQRQIYEAQQMNVSSGGGPVLVNLNPDPMFSESVRHAINPGVTTIGSDESNDIVLTGGDVVGQHCVISFEPNSKLLMIANLDDNMTFVNGRKIPTVNKGGTPSRKRSIKSDNEGSTLLLEDGSRLGVGKHYLFRLDFESGVVQEEEVIRADWEFAVNEIQLERQFSGLPVSPKHRNFDDEDESDTLEEEQVVFDGEYEQEYEEQGSEEVDLDEVLGAVNFQQQYYEEEMRREREREQAQEQELRGRALPTPSPLSAGGDTALPNEFEDMLRDMEENPSPPPRRVEIRERSENSTGYLYQPPSAEKDIMDDISKQLDGFASQMSALSKDGAADAGAADAGTADAGTADAAGSRRSAGSFNVVEVMVPQLDGNTPMMQRNSNASRTESEREFLRYESELTEKTDGGSPECTPSVGMTGKSEDMSESFVARSRAALESLRREIGGESTIPVNDDTPKSKKDDLDDDEVIMSMMRTPEQDQESVKDKGEERRELARSRMKNRARKAN